ncbi:hypothetical protein DFH07DRAFT_778669 [Mycena maculata]|uniref:Uncharacterized protein n=1 Tax=Mycena maculata TaxID=230809 RepID=A0AAD7IDN5_9AGAR|nr:hypothetical protein DFH07DRAFT_778669 [Mycena maculata]
MRKAASIFLYAPIFLPTESSQVPGTGRDAIPAVVRPRQIDAVILCDKLVHHLPAKRLRQVRRARAALCQNMALQREFKIIEYVGDFFLDEKKQVDHHGEIHKHSSLSYAFNVKLSETTTVVVDSHWFGNPMRFLNDLMHNQENPKLANCGAKEVFVNGGKRLVIFAGK